MKRCITSWTSLGNWKPVERMYSTARISPAENLDSVLKVGMGGPPEQSDTTARQGGGQITVQLINQ